MSKKVSKKKNEKQKIVKKNEMQFFKEEHFKKFDNPFIEVMKNELPKQIVLIALMVVLVIVVFMNLDKIGSFFSRLISILTPIILGWAISFIMAPLYNFIAGHLADHKNKTFVKFSRVIATFICVIIVIGISVGLIFIFVPQLYGSITRFISRTGGYLDGIRSTMENIKNDSDNDVTKHFIIQFEKTILETLEGVGNINYSAIASSVFTGFAVSVKTVLNYFVSLVVMIYSLNMKEELAMGMKRILFAFTRKDIGFKILSEVRFAKHVFSGFFVGKLLDSLIIGVLCYVGCFAMQMPYTPLVSVIVGITNIIPFFGPFIGAIPSFILILLEAPFSWKPYGFLIFILILQQIDGNIIGPKILGDTTGVGSFWVLFSILLFGGLFGFVGMIIAVPLWAVITRLFDELVTAKLKAKNYPTSSEEYKKLKEYNAELKRN